MLAQQVLERRALEPQVLEPQQVLEPRQQQALEREMQPRYRPGSGRRSY